MSNLLSSPPQTFFDESTFLRRNPYPLTPTNLPGVYKNPVPPDGLDPKTACQLDLARYGPLWRKPGLDDPPEMQQAWSLFFRREWRAQDSIVPRSQPQLGVTHTLRRLPVRQHDGSYRSTMWSGAVANAGSWSNILGYWSVPTVTRPSEPQGTEGGWNSSSWLGLDGFYISDDVLQAGVQQFVSAAGVASYVAWYEWYAPPDRNSPPYIYQTNIANFPVGPGQQLYCSVQYNGKTSASIAFANQATGQHFAITLAPPPGASCNGSSYEWIMEAPDGGEPISALPKFTPVVFTTALACNADLTATGYPDAADTLNIETDTGKVLTAVSVGTDTATIKFIG